MKLEAGKFYRTRSGKKAYVACLVNPMNPFEEFPVCGFVDGEEESQCWTVDGTFYNDPAVTVHPYDLITDWRDDATVRGFLIVNAAGEPKTIPFPERHVAEKSRANWLQWFPDQRPFAIVYVEGVGEYDLGAGG